MSFTSHIEARARTLARVSKRELNEYSHVAAKNKDKYLKSGRSVLRAIAKHYGLTDWEVSVNKAGIATSGDITLIGMFNDNTGIYISMSEPMLFNVYNSPKFMFRSVTHPRDWSGGMNQTMEYDELADDLETACEKMKRLATGRNMYAGEQV